MNYRTILKIIQESSYIRDKKYITRDYDKDILQSLQTRSLIKVITGIRRSGKSFLLKQAYKKLLDQNYPQENILFINFENDWFTKDKLNLKTLRDIYEVFLRNSDLERPCYIFLDEIQLIDAWEKFVRTIYESTQHNIFVTGSNSDLLSSEFASSLGGRILEFKIYPFSFEEYLSIQGIATDGKFEKVKNTVIIQKCFNQYNKYGGFPEIVDLPENQKVSFRDTLIDKILYTDILRRFDVQDTLLLEKLLNYTALNLTQLFTYNSLSKSLRKDNETVEQYFNYLEKAFLVQKIRKFSWKAKDVLKTQYKYYFLDNIFTYPASASSRFENLVFAKLRKKTDQRKIFFGRDEKGKEVDFVVQKDDGGYRCIQACLELNDENYDREIRSLVLTQKHLQNHKFGKNEYLLVIRDDFRQKTTELPEGVATIDAVEFLLQD